MLEFAATLWVIKELILLGALALVVLFVVAVYLWFWVDDRLQERRRLARVRKTHGPQTRQ